MRQVLLVDDESAVTNSLLHGIDWAALDLSVAGVAMNGLQALEYIQKNPVDIVITDIRMAELDGLSLSQQIYQMNRNIQIIIISGFAEFSYVQKALSYGIIGYVLKPVEYAELTRYLKLAIHKLNRYRDFGENDLLDALYQNHAGRLRQLLRARGLETEQYYAAASVSAQPLAGADGEVLAVRMGYKRYGYIAAAPFIQPALRALADDPDCSGFSYIRGPVPVQKLGPALKRLSVSAFHYFFDPAQKIFADVRRKARLPYPALISAAAEQDAPRLIELFRKIGTMPPEELSLNAAWRLYNILADDEFYGPSVALDDIYSPEHLVFCFSTFRNMIQTICARLADCSAAQPDGSLSNSAFLHMVRFVELHLSENCSLQLLAREMNMNANYLGQLFKRETGKTYSNYVTELRIERAKELLSADELSINEIAMALGFNDYFYFLKTFKRVTGCTPKQYRQRQEAGGPAELPAEAANEAREG